MTKIRVRYAPSPTGYLHIGNARAALFNYLYAKHYNGTFIVRIEDTDDNRNIADGVDSQVRNLEWLGIDFDEGPNKDNPKYGPYFQSQRVETYQKYANQLLEKGLAYKCYCTSNRLEELSIKQKENNEIPRYDGHCSQLKGPILNEDGQELAYRIRFKVPKNKMYKWNDMVKGLIEFKSDDVGGDFVIIKENGMPTYNFAVVIDDYLMEISHVLRGEDHIANTPKQLMIYEALSLKIPFFGHTSLIVNEEKKKLSKRDGGIIQFIEQYKELGYMPEAIFNFISLLGWSPNTNQEILSKEQLIELFDENRLSKSPATFDVAKLTWINNQYFKQASDETIIKLCLPFLEKTYKGFANEYYQKIIRLYKNQISYGQEIVEASKVFFEPQQLSQEAQEFMDTNNGWEIYQTFLTNLNSLYTTESIKAAIEKTKNQLGVKGKNLFMPIRIGVSKQMHGPELVPTIELILNEH